MRPHDLEHNIFGSILCGPGFWNFHSSGHSQDCLQQEYIGLHGILIKGLLSLGFVCMMNF